MEEHICIHIVNKEKVCVAVIIRDEESTTNDRTKGDEF
jgi:hypothetical protein